MEAPQSTKPIDWALYYASLGLAVFPIQKYKKDKFFRYPEYKNPDSGSAYSWKYQATTDPERIKRFFTDHPDANIGCACGQISGGLYAIDLDPEHTQKDEATGQEILISDGWERLRQYDKENGTDFADGFSDKCPMSLTGRKGNQIFFHWKGGLIRKGTADLFQDNSGLDIRGDGNFVVLPPSYHPNGNQYEWEQPLDEYELPEAPEGMSDFWAGAGQAAGERPAEQKPPFERKATGSARHNYLKSYIASVYSKNPRLQRDELLLLLEKENEKNCLPPIGSAPGDAKDEFQRSVAPMVDWVLRKQKPAEEPEAPRTAAGSSKVLEFRFIPGWVRSRMPPV